jgi:uncharacterized protein YoxC
MAHLVAALADAGASLAATLVAHVAQAAQVGAQASALPDTIVTKQAPIEPGWFERFQETLRALTTLAILVLTVAVVPAAWNFRKSYQKVSDLLDRVYADVNPLTHHAARIAENVDYVTTAVRADAERASALLTQAEARLRAAIDRAEARARDFEALVHVAQQEAEHTLVSAASTAAGVREGVASLRDDLAAALRGEPVPYDVRVDEGATVPDDLALVDVRPRPVREAPRPDHTHASAAGLADDLSEGVIDADLDPVAARPPVRPRLRPRDRG